MSGLTSDLICQIFSFLEAEDILLLCLRVCKDWYAWGRSPLLWASLIQRDFAKTETSGSPHNYLEASQTSTLSEFIKAFYQSVEDYGMDGRKNSGSCLGSVCYNGKLDKLKAMTLTPEMLNTPICLTGWVYYGNFSATHSAAIALASDVNQARDWPCDYDLVSPYSGFSKSECSIPRTPDCPPDRAPLAISPLDLIEDHYLVWAGHCHGRRPFQHPIERRGTPLHWAAIGGQFDVVKYLASLPGIDLNAKVTFYNATALDICRKNGNLQIVTFLRGLTDQTL